MYITKRLHQRSIAIANQHNFKNEFFTRLGVRLIDFLKNLNAMVDGVILLAIAISVHRKFLPIILRNKFFKSKREEGRRERDQGQIKYLMHALGSKISVVHVRV